MLRNDVGSLLPLVALLISVIIGMAAIGLELTYGSASLEQSRHYAKLAAIAALEAYSSDDSVSEDDRLANALARANEILQANSIVGDRSQTASTLTFDGANNSPQLIPGRWYYQQIGNNNPCADYPCFIKIETNQPVPLNQPVQPANAFQIVGELYDAVPARFARALGFTQLFSFKVNAIATMVPRQGCFLVDISASMVQETHLKGASQFAFDLSLDADGNYNFPEHAAQWASLPLTRGLAQTNPTEHYKDDYLDFTVFSDTEQTTVQKKYHPDINASAAAVFSSDYLSSKTYKIDAFRDSSYQGPEPLRTVFEGLRTALESFKGRAVVGDKACIIFYDNTLAWPRVVELTDVNNSDDFDYLIGLTNFSINQDQTGNINPDSGFGLMMRHGLFPASGSTTNMRLAVINALGQFATMSGFDKSVPVSNFIVLIGDGLSNCSNCLSQDQILSDFDLDGNGVSTEVDPDIITKCLGNPEWSNANGVSCKDMTLDADGDGTIDSSDHDFLNFLIENPLMCEAVGCRNDGNYYSQSMKQLIEFVERRVVPLDIPIHVVHVGNHVAPHTVDKHNEDLSACLTDAELRTNEIPFVRGGDANGNELSANDLFIAFANMSPENPFYQAADPLYRIATQTRGIWAPLRPASSSPCDECDPSALRRTVDSDCSGRGKQDQMNSYMERIVGESPYRIVQER